MSFEPDGRYKTFVITEKDDGIRPAGKPDQCFYCGHKVGEKHENGCVITWRNKKVRLLAVVEFEEEVPEHWTDEDILFRYNESTWCASNLYERFNDNNCGCDVTVVYIPEQVQTIAAPTLESGGDKL